MRLLRTLLLLILLAAPSWSAEDPVLGVLLLDDEWRWGPGNELRLPSREGLVTDWREMLDPSVAGELTEAQKQVLLEDPRRLLASAYTAKILRPARLLLIGPTLEGRVTALHVDLQTSVRRVVVGPADVSEREGREALVAEVLAAGGPVPVPVVVNPESGLYHRPDAPHLSAHAPAVAVGDRSEADSQGYRPCTICFPEANRALHQDDFERELGRYGAGLIENRYRVSQDEAARARVTAVGTRIMERNRLPDQGYRFIVLDSDDINAFSVPTGPIYITSGMLNVMETEDELAGVLGHEIGHAERHHMVQQYDRDTWVGVLGSVVGNVVGGYWTRRATELVAGLFSRGFSREFELDADREAVFLTYGSGYRPGDFVLTLVKLRELSEQTGRVGLEWLDTHPNEEGRIREVQDLIARLEPLTSATEGLAARGDGDLAAWLRRQARSWVDDPDEIQAFLDAYGRLVLPEPEPPEPSR